jgi:hypothetical protein
MSGERRHLTPRRPQPLRDEAAGVGERPGDGVAAYRKTLSFACPQREPSRSPRASASAMVDEMAHGKAADPVTLLAELRERARALEQRVSALGRHL